MFLSNEILWALLLFLVNFLGLYHLFGILSWHTNQHLANLLGRSSVSCPWPLGPRVRGSGAGQGEFKRHLNAGIWEFIVNSNSSRGWAAPLSDPMKPGLFYLKSCHSVSQDLAPESFLYHVIWIILCIFLGFFQDPSSNFNKIFIKIYIYAKKSAENCWIIQDLPPPAHLP